MPRRNALHHHRPAVGPASRLFVVLPFAQPTAFTAGCGLVRYSVSLPEPRGVFLAPGYACTLREEWLCRYRDTVLPKGAHVGTRETMGCGALEKSARVRRRKGVYLARVLDDPGPIKLPFPPARYTTSTAAV